MEPKAEIKHFQDADLEVCARLLIQAYNGPPWHNHWTPETAEKYLKEYTGFPRSVGFVIYDEEKAVGAAFCRERTWWNNDEIYIEEFYISPVYQRQGYGKALLEHIEEYARKRNLAGFTLLTNKYMPAPRFWKKNGFIPAEHIAFMYKAM